MRVQFSGTIIKIDNSTSPVGSYKGDFSLKIDQGPEKKFEMILDMLMPSLARIIIKKDNLEFIEALIDIASRDDLMQVTKNFSRQQRLVLAMFSGQFINAMRWQVYLRMMSDLTAIGAFKDSFSTSFDVTDRLFQDDFRALCA